MKKDNGVLLEVTNEDLFILDSNPDKFWEGVNEIGPFAFMNSGIKMLAIPKCVKKIAPRAFHSCKYLEVVALPEGIEVVERYTFQWCWKLTKVLLPDSIKEIKDCAFMGCEKLENIFIPDGVERIGNGVFANCSNLVKLTLPESLSEIGDKVFHSCGRLKEVYSMGKAQFNEKTIEGMSVGAKLYIRQFEEECAVNN